MQRRQSSNVTTYPKPIIKWVGGKTQIIDTLLQRFPKTMHNYHEVFLGGGSVLLALLSMRQTGAIEIVGDVYAYDLNEPLLYVYKNIQSNPGELYAKIQELIADYTSCGDGTFIDRTPTTIEEAKRNTENYYYWTRIQYNRLTDVEKRSMVGSAMFIFLNKTCFRGLFRVGPNGFNVPYGHYNNPEIVNREHLDEISRLIQNVYFECCDFAASMNRVGEGDFAYLDPPYAPETSTSFVGYTLNGFDDDQHLKLFQQCSRLTTEKKKMMLSNADVALVRQHFATDIYTLHSIECKRAINSKNPDAKTQELIITNY